MIVGNFFSETMSSEKSIWTFFRLSCLFMKQFCESSNTFGKVIKKILLIIFQNTLKSWQKPESEFLKFFNASEKKLPVNAKV